MLAKLRSTRSPPDSPKTETNAGSNVGTNANSRSAKLKKRKQAKSSKPGKRASAIEFSSSKSSLASSAATNVSSNDSDIAVGPLNFKEPVEIARPSPDALTANRNQDTIAAPHRNTSPTNPPLQTRSTSTVQKAESHINQAKGNLSQETDEPKPRRRRPPSDTRRYSTCRLKKGSSESPVLSPLSAMKRRFSYTPPATNRTSDYGLSEEELKSISITATRIPDFSSAYESDKIPSPAVQVTIVDQLPHQKSISPTSWRSSTASRRLSRIPATIAERDVNEEFLLEQQEVLSYLQNTLLGSISPVSYPNTVASDGGLPITPPATKPNFQQPPNSINPADFINEMISEFPYLLGNDDAKSIFETPPLHLRDKSKPYGLDLTNSALSISSSRGRVHTEFPPSPPQSERRQSMDESRALLEELGLESDSMRSFVDAINNAASPHSSFAYTDSYDNESLCGDDESLSLQFESLQFDGPRPWTSQSFDPDNDSMFHYASPILRTGRASFADVEFGTQIMSRSASQASKSTAFEDVDLPISEVLAERRRSKPQLAPLVVTPIAQGQYGPPIQRRHYRKGRGKFSSPMSARGGLEAVKPTLVKVVEEEIVEYTPIEEGEKGWVKQRRVSRGGDWIVVEREILGPGAI